MVDCYSQRMLNPFHGIVNVVETEDADAVCRDGVHWELYVHGGFETAEVDGRLREIELPDVKFGRWSAADGLRRAPARLTMDYQELDAAGSHLLEVVKARAGELPFPLRDHLELWLLHGDDMPVALLNSAVNLATREHEPNLQWRPGQVANGKFHPDDDDGSAGRLATRVNSAAGRPPRAQWFRREADGGGVGLDGFALDDALVARTLPREVFPELLLREVWPDPEDTSLARAFIEWQAPVLLQLQTLGSDTRARLEHAARRWARAVAKYHRLYPETVEEEQVTAALVEARMRDAVRHPDDTPEEEVLSPDALLLPFGNE